MDDKKYLKWYNKVGYGAGDVGGNVVYAFIAFFVMIYLTDTMGMNPGIVGTLIMVARIFDGVLTSSSGHSSIEPTPRWVRLGPGCSTHTSGVR